MFVDDALVFWTVENQLEVTGVRRLEWLAGWAWTVEKRSAMPGEERRGRRERQERRLRRGKNNTRTFRPPPRIKTVDQHRTLLDYALVRSRAVPYHKYHSSISNYTSDGGMRARPHQLVLPSLTKSCYQQTSTINLSQPAFLEGDAELRSRSLSVFCCGMQGDARSPRSYAAGQCRR